MAIKSDIPLSLATLAGNCGPVGPIELAVIGRGIVGLSAAFALAQAGRPPLVIGPDVQPGMATLAAVGSANLKGNIDAGSPLFALKIAGHRLLRPWLKELEAASGLRVPALTGGSFEPFTDLAGYRQVRERVLHRRFTGLMDVQLTGQAELRRLFPAPLPAAAAAAGAFHYDQDLWYEPEAALAALRLAIERRGGQVVARTVTRLLPHPDRGLWVETTQGRLWVLELVLAGGVFSNELLAASHVSGYAQEPVEGETLVATGAPFSDAFFKLGTLNLVTEGGRIFYGSSSRRQASSAFCAPPDYPTLVPSPFLAAAERHFALPDAAASPLFRANFTQRWGIRGRYPDRAPRLCPLFLPGGRRFWASLGFYKNGLQLAPLFAQKLVAAASTPLDLGTLSTTYPTNL